MEDERGEDREDEDDEDGESRFGTAKSYTTAISGGGDTSTSGAGSRMGLRDIWGTAMGGEDLDNEIDPKRQQELEKAVQKLEDEVESFKIEPVGPIVADLADFRPTPTTTTTTK